MYSIDEDAINTGSTTERFSFSPRVGFLDSMATSYDATTRETAGNIQEHISNVYGSQDKSLRGLGESEVPNLHNINLYDMTKMYSGEDDGDPVDMTEIDTYNKKILSLRKKYPDKGLLTTEEMWGKVRETAQQASSADADQRRSIAGSIGGFVGGAAGSFDPRYNLINTLTLPVGGVGKTIVGRALTEGAAQGGIEAFSEFTGQRQARRMLGLDTSWEGTIARVGLTAAGGTIIRGGLELGHAGYKRWFSDTPKDPAPPPPKDPAPPPPKVDPAHVAPEPPISPVQQHAVNMSRLTETDPGLARTRMGSSRVVTDIDHVTKALDDWGGELPEHMRPRTDTAIPTETDGVRFADDMKTREAIGQLTVDEVARRIDPDVFRVYDNLVSEINSYRGAIETARPDAKAQHEAVADLSDKIDEIQRRIDKGSNAQVARKEKSLGKQRDALIAEREKKITEMRSSDTPEMAGYRDRLVKADLKLRDQAPIISRAYARARGEWELGKEYRDAVGQMVRRGDSTLGIPAEAATDAPAPRPTSPLTGTPMASRITPDKMKAGDSHADAAVRTAAEDVKAQGDTLTEFRDKISALKDDAEEIMLGNQTLKLDQVIEVPNKNGTGSREMSVRELLDELKQTNEDLKAVTTCST